MATPTLSHRLTSTEEIYRIFALQKAHRWEAARSTYTERKAKIKKLRDAVKDRREEIREALYKDFRKPAAETDLTEMYLVTSNADHALKHLKQWMSPHKVKTPLTLTGTSSYVQYESKGQSLIIAPWNYPLTLTLGPLVGALAAGNSVMVKPSEHTAHTSALMKKIISDLFEEKEVAVIEGAVPETTELLQLPFNHIFFYG